MSGTVMTSTRRLTASRRTATAVALLAALLIGAAPAVAHQGDGVSPTPIVFADGACGRLFPAATPVAITGPLTEAPPFEQVPFDLLATDAIATHQTVLLALTAVATEQAEQPELRDWATTLNATLTTEQATLTAVRSAAHPEAAPVPLAYQVALLDRALAAAGAPAGSGEAEIADPLLPAAVLCGATATGPFDLAAIDLITAELQRGVALGVTTSLEASDPALTGIARAQVDRETEGLGELAVWRDAWFGPDAPVVTAPGG